MTLFFCHVQTSHVLVPQGIHKPMPIVFSWPGKLVRVQLKVAKTHSNLSKMRTRFGLEPTYPSPWAEQDTIHAVPNKIFIFFSGKVFSLVLQGSFAIILVKFLGFQWKGHLTVICQRCRCVDLDGPTKFWGFDCIDESEQLIILSKEGYFEIFYF